MIDDLHKAIEKLKIRIKLSERLSLASLVGICISLKFGHQEWIWLICFIVVFQIYRIICKRKLAQQEYLVKEVEERTQEIRSEKDAIQEESEKLASALNALADAQDELVRQERMATVGQLTQGLVDRILNPLNYINNFANLSSGLTKDLMENLENQKDVMNKEVYEDSVDLLNMMSSNLEKISEHGFNTVRIVKAMEELLKDRRGNLTLTNINGLCRIALDKLRKSYEPEIREKNIQIVFDNLTLSLMMEVNVEQFGKVLSNMLKNAMYALLRKAETVAFKPEIYLGLKVNKDMLEITIRDNGTGIDTNIKEKIFAPFFTTKTTSEAAGVGLYLCREIVQNHRGTIQVESKKGEYTEFVINIPVYQPKTATPPKNEE